MDLREPEMSRLQQWALRLNRRQTHALIGGIALFFLAGLVPSWRIVRYNELGGYTTEFAGFHFISEPPEPPNMMYRVETRVNWGVLLITEIACIGLSAAAVRLMRDKNNEAGSTYGQYR